MKKKVKFEEHYLTIYTCFLLVLVLIVTLGFQSFKDGKTLEQQQLQIKTMQANITYYENIQKLIVPYVVSIEKGLSQYNETCIEMQGNVCSKYILVKEVQNDN